MGLFSSLFGSTSSDKADKLRQDALNAFNAVKTPELSALQVQLTNYVNAGKLTPEAAETALLTSNAFNDIVTDPSYVGAQKQALQQLQQVATQGGMTAVDKAQLNDITNQQNQQNRSQNEATMEQARQRGVGGSDLNAVNQLINEQGAADRAANAGVNVAANAQQRALQAMQAAGQTGAGLESQAYGEAANKANAANAIDLYNKQALNQTNLFNTQTANAAQAANLANAQAINNANTGSTNANREYNAQQNQTVYNDQLQKAQGVAGVNQNAANAAQAAHDKEQGASLGLISGALQGGAEALGGAFGGPAGAAVAGNAMKGSTQPNSQFGTVYDPTQKEMGYSEGGEVDSPEHPDHMANGGHVHCYSHGGEAYHHPDCYMAEGGKVEDSTSTAKMPDYTSPNVPHVDVEAPDEDALMTKLTRMLTGMSKEKTGDVPEEPKKKYDEGGNVEASTDTAHIPAAKKEEPPKPERTFIEKLGDLLGSHADTANAILNENQGGEIPKDFRAGGPVPGHAKVEGDSPKNDTVDAKLSPGEIVIPRSAANDEDEFKTFMAKFEPKKRKMAKGGAVPSAVKIPMEARALANLHARISKLEGR